MRIIDEVIRPKGYVDDRLVPFPEVDQLKSAQAAHNSSLTLSKDDLAQLTKLLGRNIADADDLMLAARNVTTLSVKGLEEGDITLEPYLLNRLKSGCHPTEYFPKFVRERVKELLAGYAGC